MNFRVTISKKITDDYLFGYSLGGEMGGMKYRSLLLMGERFDAGAVYEGQNSEQAVVGIPALHSGPSCVSRLAGITLGRRQIRRREADQGQSEKSRTR